MAAKTVYKKIEDYDKSEFDGLVGKMCKVLCHSKWFGAKTTEPAVWLRGRIVKVSWGRDDVFKKECDFPAFTIDVWKCKKYNTARLPCLTQLPHQVEGCIMIKV